MARHLTCASLLALAFMRRCRIAQDFGVRLCKKTWPSKILYLSKVWPQLFRSVRTSSCLFFTLCFSLSFFFGGLPSPACAGEGLGQSGTGPCSMMWYPWLSSCPVSDSSLLPTCEWSLQAMRMSVEHLDRRVHRVHSKKISPAQSIAIVIEAFRVQALCSVCSI